jgi:hypothetical protein
MWVDIEWLSSLTPASALRYGRGTRPACGALLLSALCAFTSGVAAQRQAPSDDERRSMYCAEVLRAEIGLQHHMISAADGAAAGATTAALRQQWINTSAELLQGLAKLEAVLYRLQVYMLPRIRELDSFALASAIRQGNADFDESSSMANRCAVECETPQPTNERLQACSASCSENALLTRVSTCENPTWLPL